MGLAALEQEVNRPALDGEDLEPAAPGDPQHAAVAYEKLRVALPRHCEGFAFGKGPVGFGRHTPHGVRGDVLDGAFDIVHVDGAGRRSVQAHAKHKEDENRRYRSCCYLHLAPFSNLSILAPSLRKVHRASIPRLLHRGAAAHIKPGTFRGRRL